MTSLQNKLPIGIQTFAKLRKGGFYYVDKTPPHGLVVGARGWVLLPIDDALAAHTADAQWLGRRLDLLLDRL